MHDHADMGMLWPTAAALRSLQRPAWPTMDELRLLQSTVQREGSAHVAQADLVQAWIASGCPDFVDPHATENHSNSDVDDSDL